MGQPQPGFPRVDWQLYDWICFSHRGAIVRALTRPMQPSAIQKAALFQDSKRENERQQRAGCDTASIEQGRRPACQNSRQESSTLHPH